MTYMRHVRFTRRRKLWLWSARISYNLTAGTTLGGVTQQTTRYKNGLNGEWMNELQTNSMAQAVRWTAESRIARQESTRFEITWRLIAVFVTKLTSDRILCQINPVYTSKSQGFWKWFPSFWFSNRILYCMLHAL
jgi:hypothetical protein